MNDFEKYLNKTGEIGFVQEVVGSIAYADGLPTVSPDELIVFEDGTLGQVFSLKEDVVEILTFSKIPIKVGSKVTRTAESVKIPVGNTLLSNVIDPFGNAFEHHKPFEKPQEMYSIESSPLGITKRQTIKKYFETGVAIVDLMVPLGKGQRELVIGDRKTGKTNFVLQSVVSAASQGDVCIYAAIGKNKIDIKRIEEFFSERNVLGNIIIVASSSQDPPGVIYLTPYSAMTIAEYFRDQGKDVLIILDDLSTHAKFYREISLIGKRFPGRDSYPGDIFYIHARLLERAGNFSAGTGKEEVAITCLPVIETSQGDISGYIQTNLMSMTDGHVYFDSNKFSQGRRPSVNPFLSVTRVGRQTQSDSKRSISRELFSFLTLHEKMQNIVHFGSELSESVRVVIETGNKILDLFDQEIDSVVPSNVQSVVLSLLWGEDFKKIDVVKLRGYKDKIVQMYKKDKNYKKMVDEIVINCRSFNETLAQVKIRLPQFMIEFPTPPAAATTIQTAPIYGSGGGATLNPQGNKQGDTQGGKG